MSKIMYASGKQKKGKRFDQSAYSKAVPSFYSAVRYTDSGLVEKYCHLTGWQDDTLKISEISDGSVFLICFAYSKTTYTKLYLGLAQKFPGPLLESRVIAGSYFIFDGKALLIKNRCLISI